MKGITPAQRRMVTLLGAKEAFSNGRNKHRLLWIMEALELLLMAEIERAAIADNVDVKDGSLFDLVTEAGRAEFEEAGQRQGGKNGLQ